MELFFYILGIIVVIGGLIGIFYIILYNRLQRNIIRINESESVIDDTLRERYDLVISAEKIIVSETEINDVVFEEIRDLKNKKITNFEFDRKTTECISVIRQIKKDYSSLQNNQNFKEIIQKIKNSDEKIESAKAFYNKYTSKLNILVRKFPSNIVAKIHGIKEKTYFDNKDMSDDIINDFKY